MDNEYKHPSFPQPEDISAIIWRYMDDKKFKWLLDCGRLFMPSVDRFDDEQEGTRPKGDNQWWAKEASKASSDVQRRIIEHNHKLLSNFVNKFRPNYYVSCWHMSPSENRKMWCQYVKGPESVAIWTTYAALREALPNYVEIGTVRYIDYLTERVPRMNTFEYIMHKRVCFSWEREVRAVAFLPTLREPGTENLFESKCTKGFRVYAPKINIGELIQGIVLHPEASAVFESEIKELCAKNGLPCPLRSSLLG